ncbi:hypothetical protein P8625_00325 [Tenacibaculum tangerinum]|uniref:Lipoprotein n=1 Tax=Tenacibaculum tangerinum TaxID=3038772 RepID=A0ABY8L2H1_9FLAO|nr:hypothetical protein [Tenacibaculum tangerinum]WGH75642.1 hypothetical protein P8625_00325 [Tenacibaculum tangerinum]
MKTKILKIIILILIFVSCKNKTTERKQIKINRTSEVEKVKETEILTLTDSIEINLESTDKMLDFLSAKYSKVYEYKGMDSRQLIGINFITKDSIDYYLSSETMPCDTEYYGKAFNQNYGLDSEVDEDENGISYPSNEYSNDQQDYVIYIRVALDSTKLKIGYADNVTDGTDCAPNTVNIMKKIK